jgi:hypothetical protein
VKTVTVKINCDKCNADISPKVTGYPHEYILRVEAIDIARHKPGQGVYSVMITPPINEDLYFCNINCMQSF